MFGIIGLGKMGLNLSFNAVDHGQELAVYDINQEAVKTAADYSEKILPVASIDDMIATLPTPRIVWVMLPSGQITNETIDYLIEHLDAKDIIIDGGNSNYKDNLKQAEVAHQAGLYYFDAGTSGGMSGARNGANFMIGGDQEAWPIVEPIIAALAQEDGYLYTGRVGSGHYLKMIHNGIEYGMMQAIAEGFEILDASPFDYDFEKVAKLWNHGSVIRGWLMELAEQEFAKDPHLENIIGRVQASGEGKWTVEESLDLEVPAPVIALSLMMRNRSLQDDTVTGKVLAALRNGFGGHDVTRK
ncbi:phosphogluconate dehydrogenase (NAD(+)-dependent, decarboxylating) [Streptococcus parauberis]|nr:decarboxylating 6-phosphogluconate dehydrogenase [Streptococcus parauberis]